MVFTLYQGEAFFLSIRTFTENSLFSIKPQYLACRFLAAATHLHLILELLHSSVHTSLHPVKRYLPFSNRANHLSTNHLIIT